MSVPSASAVRRRRVRSSVLMALIVAISAVAAAALPALAQEASSGSPPSKTPTTLSVTFEPSSMEGIPHYLAARLVTQDGSAVIGERVSIRRVADVFGGRTVTIGRASTDHSGVARVPIVPREEVYKVTASFSGSDGLAASQVEDDVVFPVDSVIIPEEVPRGGLVDPQLRPLADVMPLVIGGVVIVVWIVLLGLTAVTLRRIRSSRPHDPEASSRFRTEAPDTGSGPRHE